MYSRKLNLSILHWVCLLVKHSKTMRSEVLLRARVISVMIAIILFSNFTEYDEFEELSLYSKYNRVKEFNVFFIIFKSVETKQKKTETRFRKERIMKNVDELYKKVL